jgi:hypothetical protein
MAAAVSVLALGCGQNAKNAQVELPYERPPDQEQLIEADELARTYLRAAADGDSERLCALRTRGALRELGGRAACERKLTGVTVFHRRTLRPAQLAGAEVLSGDTNGHGIVAHVTVDYGKATIESGHAVAGKVLQFRLRMEGGRYRVSDVGAAVYVD